MRSESSDFKVEGLSQDRSQQQPRIRLRSLLPTLAVFVSTSGLGLAILTWLFVKLKIPVSEVFQSGYFLVDEGVNHSEGAIESAKLQALTATSFISTLIAATSPILMALIAYRIAYIWVSEERKPPSDKAKQVGPTPLQYGLLLQVLSASSVISLYDSVCYLLKGKSRAQAPSYFATAVVLGVVVYLITHLVGLADLWLHATTSAVLFNLTISDNSTIINASVAFNESRCDASYYLSPGRTICLASQLGWAYQPEEKLYIPMGQAVIANYSDDRKAITLADEDNLAIVVPLTIDALAKFQASSFGALARCESITSQCLPGAGTGLNCSNLGINAIPTVPEDVNSVVLVAPPDKWNRTRFEPSTYKYGPEFCCMTNPVQSLLQIRWRSQKEDPTDVPNSAVYGGQAPVIDIYATCNLTFYNLTVAYDGRAPNGKYWSVVPGSETLSTEAFASTLAGPFAWQLIMDNLTSNIKSRAMLANSTEKVMAALNQELSRLALGFVSDSFFFTPATEVQIFHPTILGRYPLAPVLVFVALLFVYGLIALAVFVMSFDLTSDIISIPPSLQNNLGAGDKNEISSLELAQLRLLSPLPLVAQMFDQPIRAHDSPGPGDADAKSAAISETALFSEEPSSKAQTRLRLGLEDTELRPRYGVWRQK